MIDETLDKFKEETEDLWDQFMEGESPDPQKYDEFLDNAYAKALTAIYEIGLEKIGEDEPRRESDETSVDNFKAIRNDLRAEQRKAWAKACGVAE